MNFDTSKTLKQAWASPNLAQELLKDHHRQTHDVGREVCLSPWIQRTVRSCAGLIQFEGQASGDYWAFHYRECAKGTTASVASQGTFFGDSEGTDESSGDNKAWQWWSCSCWKWVRHFRTSKSHPYDVTWPNNANDQFRCFFCPFFDGIPSDKGLTIHIGRLKYICRLEVLRALLNDLLGFSRAHSWKWFVTRQWWWVVWRWFPSKLTLSPLTKQFMDVGKDVRKTQST